MSDAGERMWFYLGDERAGAWKIDVWFSSQDVYTAVLDARVDDVEGFWAWLGGRTDTANG